MLDSNFQPITIDPNKLLIGIAEIEFEGNKKIANMGSLTEATLDITTTVKERYTGYPLQRRSVETDTVTAILTFTTEEVGSKFLVGLLSSLVTTLGTEDVTLGSTKQNQYQTNMYASYAAGDYIKMSAIVQMLPELTINWQDNWGGLQLKFECVGLSASTIIRRSVEPQLNRRRTATTIDKSNFCIGKPQVKINSKSVGAIQSVSITLKGTTKKVLTNKPTVTKSFIYLDSSYEINIVAEENLLDPRAIDDVTGVVTDIKLEVIQAFVDGSSLSLLFNHAAIQSDMTMAPTNDWTGVKQKILPWQIEGDSVPIVIIRHNPAV